jgi:hypothetical protein
MNGDAVAWRPPDALVCAYLLGVYLGDGCVSERERKGPNGTDLRIFCDSAYPGIVQEIAEAMTATVAGSARVTVRQVRTTGCAIVACVSAAWPVYLPQHGPGRKHDRPIVLAPWQQAIVDVHPEAFLRGLIHSDGCRTVNRFTTRLPSGRVAEYAYPRYFFSNLSGDIRRLFCEACDALGIRWTQSNHRNISVSHRASVARLDAFVGPKA